MLRSFYSLSIVVWFLSLVTGFAYADDSPPNIIVIFCDDLGYGDLGCYGAKKHRTPHLDRMASQGIRLTSFYSTCSVCTPSRASLMTGCYPRRVNMHLDAKDRCVLFAASRKGLHPDEVTIAEVLKKRGYATSCIGKWHLGDHPNFMPTRQGFDEYFGIPYSNDMGSRKVPLPLVRGLDVVEAPAIQNTLTQRYTDEAIRFITKNKEKPFFIYLPHTMPHLPLRPGKAFVGKSKNGKYGDAIEEIDWSTGAILETLKKLKLDKKTLVLFTSDNGSRQPGSNGPLRGKKGRTDEGGMRVPCIVWYPGQIPSDTSSDEISTTMDLLPTFAKLSGGKVPEDRTIDGENIWPILSGEKGAKSQYQAFYYYQKGQLQAVRSGPWKLFVAMDNKLKSWGEEGKSELKLFNLDDDVHEDRNLADEKPEIVRKLLQLVKTARADLGDYQQSGKGQRMAGFVKTPSPRLKKNPE